MKEKVTDAYFLIVLTVFNVLSTNVKVLGIRIENFVLLVLTVGVLVIYIISIRGWKTVLKQLSPMDITVVMFCIANLIRAIYIACVGGAGDESILLLVIVLSYFIFKNSSSMHQDYMLIFSIANLVIYTSLLGNAMDGTEGWIVGDYLLQGNDLLSWLILSIVAGIISYAMEERQTGIYIVQVLLGSFLLFLQKNFLGICIVGVTFFLVLLWIPTTKKLVRKMGILLFAYALLFFNMSLIVNYTSLILHPVPYSVEMSVYMMLLLAVLGLVSCICWDHLEKEPNVVFTRKVISSIKKALVAVVALVIMIIPTLLSGDVFGYPELWAKLLLYLRLGFVGNPGIIGYLLDTCGVIGVLTILFLLFFILVRIVFDNEKKVPQKPPVYKVIGTVYLLQCMCVTQSLRVTIMYICFTLLLLKGKSALER